MRPAGIAVLAAALTAAGSLGAQDAPPDARRIMRKAFEVSRQMEELERQYTSVERVEERKLDRNGKVKQTESKTFDVAHLCGRNYERLIAVDDQPLSEREDTKERAKLDKCIEKLRHETPKARAKRLAKEAEELEDRRKMTREVLNTFDFEIAGEEFVRGVNAWRIAATPKQGYEPEFRKARFLTKLRGMIWIAQDNYGWVRTEAETIDDASFGLFLLKLKKGSTLEFEQAYVNGEVWLIDRFKLRFNAKVAMLKSLRREVEISWSDFKKFAAESRIVAGPVD